MDSNLINNGFKNKVITYMKAKGITIEILAESNNLDVDQLAEYFSKDIWNDAACKFFFDELGSDFESWLSQPSDN